MDQTDEVVKGAVDILQLMIGMALGAALTLAFGVAAWIVLRIVGRRSPTFHLMMRRIKIPFVALFLVAGCWLGLSYSAADAARDALSWVDPLQQALLIFTIIMSGWLGVAMSYTLEDVATARSEENTTSRRVTQAQMLRRVLQVVIAISVIVAVVLTFPAARPAMASVLASAGVISLVAGIAAQDSLSNTFAGLQLTFTDALRVGDIIVVDQTMGTVEEVTLTYVVMRVWDERRIIVPSTRFTKNRFENLTRQHSKMLGTVELKLDWRAPIDSIRTEVDRLLAATDLWDHRTVNVQVTDSAADWIMVRVVVSAQNTGDLWDLRCYLREHLVDWLVREAPYALARTRLQPEQLVEVDHDRSEEEIVHLARELHELNYGTDPLLDSAQQKKSEAPVASKQEARVKAVKQRAGRVRRQRIRERRARLDKAQSPVPTEDAVTRIISPAEMNAIADAHTCSEGAKPQQSTAEPTSKPRGKSASRKTSAEPNSGAQTPKTKRIAISDRLYSGDAEAEERSKMYAGPGEEVLRQREDTATLRAFRDGSISEAEALERLGNNNEAKEIVRAEAAEQRKRER